MRLNADLKKHAKEIAAKVGCTPKYVEMILRGERRPSATVARDLEQHTGISRLRWLYPEEHGSPVKSLVASEAA